MCPYTSLFVSHETLLGVCCSATYETLLGAIFVSYGALSGTISDFACLIGLFQTCSVCVTSGALSGTNVSTTGIQNLMESMLGHELPLIRGE